MKLSSLSLSTAVIIGLVIYILYLRACSGPAPCPDGRGIRTDTIHSVIHDTSKPKVITVYKPGDPIIKWRDGLPPEHLKALRENLTLLHDTLEIVREIPAIVDTQAVIEDYYSKVVQKDSVKRDGLSVYTTDTVYKNRIIGRVWEIKQATQKAKGRMFYYGGGFHTSLFLNKGLSSEAISSGHIDLGYINKKGQHLKVDLMRSAGHWHEGISFYHTF